MADLEKVQVVLEAKVDAFRKALQNIQKATRKVFQDINKEMASARPPEYNQALSQVERMRTSMRLYAASAKVASGAFKYTNEFVAMSQDLQQSTADAASLREQLEQLNRYADAAEASGDLGMAEGYRANAEQVAEQLELVERRADSVRVSIARLAEEGRLTKFAGAAVILRRIGSALGSVAKNAGQLAGGAIRAAGGAFSSLIHRMSESISHLRLFRRSAGSAGTGLGNLTRSIFNAQLALRLLSSAARWVKSAVAEGLKNLQTAMPTSAAANSINQLTASLSQLKNAIGAAAAPILSAIAPALNTLINLAITAANAVGALFAALTGQKYVAAVSGVSDGLGAAASNAGAANENAQKLKRTLMGFDQINKLDDADSGSSGGGGGGGGGAGGVTGGFVEAEIPESIQKFADMIKAAWEKADFTEIGNIVGEKMIGAMNAIPWDKIQETANKGAKSLATFLNGVLTANIDGNTVGSSIGSTLANAVNTGFGAVRTFAENFSWRALGSTISDSINSFFNTWSPSLTAEAISGIATGILTTFTTAVQRVRWSEVGSKCAELLLNIDWSGILSGAAGLAGSAVGAIAAFIGGFIGEGVSGAGVYFTDKIEECGGNVIAGIYKGINDALDGVQTWCYNNIFLPFYNGLKASWDNSLFGDIFGELPELKVKVDAEKGGTLAEDGNVGNVMKKRWWGTNILSKMIGVTRGPDLRNDGDVGNTVKKHWWGADVLDKAISVVRGSSLAQDGDVGTVVKKHWWGANVLDKSISVIKGSSLAEDGNVGNVMKKHWWGAGVLDKAISVVKGSSLASDGSVANVMRKHWWGANVLDKSIGLVKSGGWSGWSVERWVESKMAGRSVTVPVSLSANKILVPGGYTKELFATGGIRSGGRWLPVTAAAGGGSFSMGQMFIAREAGPELVGTIGGNTAVMNNDQIVSSVAAGVAQAVASVMSAFVSQMNSGGDVTVYIDGEELTTAVVRGMRRQDKKNNPKVVFGG